MRPYFSNLLPILLSSTGGSKIKGPIDSNWASEKVAAIFGDTSTDNVLGAAPKPTPPPTKDEDPESRDEGDDNTTTKNITSTNPETKPSIKPETNPDTKLETSGFGTEESKNMGAPLLATIFTAAVVGFVLLASFAYYLYRRYIHKEDRPYPPKADIQWDKPELEGTVPEDPLFDIRFPPQARSVPSERAPTVYHEIDGIGVEIVDLYLDLEKPLPALPHTDGRPDSRFLFEWI